MYVIDNSDMTNIDNSRKLHFYEKLDEIENRKGDR